PRPPHTHPHALHDALPISQRCRHLQRESGEMPPPLAARWPERAIAARPPVRGEVRDGEKDDRRADVVEAVDEVERQVEMHIEDADRKSTRLNSSHEWMSYA